MHSIAGGLEKEFTTEMDEARSKRGSSFFHLRASVVSFTPKFSMNIKSKISRKQAEICLALVQEIDQAVVKNHQPADQVLARFYRQHREYGARDRRFLSDAVFSWFRWRGWLKNPEKENIAAAILLDTDEIPPQLEYFGLNLPKVDLKPAGRLTLEEKAEYLCHELNFLFLKILKFPSIELVPDWLSERLYFPPGIDPEQHFNQCIKSFQNRPPTWLRLPCFQYEKELHLLGQAGIELENHSFIKQAAFIKNRKNFDSGKFPEIEIQDLASQCVGICCNPKPGEKWWDVCAGSGGKSLHLADLMRDNGFILATDVRPAILKQLSERLKKKRCRSIKISTWNGKSDPASDKNFDGVLVDAPCSGLGTWARNPDARWRISSRQIGEYSEIQKNLLQIAATKVRPGGQLVYSTCTLTRTENIEVITAFLEQHPEFHLEKLINPLNREAPCGNLLRRSSSGYGGQDFAEPSEAKRVIPPHPNSVSGQDFPAKEGEPAEGIIWIWPWAGNCNGMFIAVMKKA